MLRKHLFYRDYKMLTVYYNIAHICPEVFFINLECTIVSINPSRTLITSRQWQVFPAGISELQNLPFVIEVLSSYPTFSLLGAKLGVLPLIKISPKIYKKNHKLLNIKRQKFKAFFLLNILIKHVYIIKDLSA